MLQYRKYLKKSKPSDKNPFDIPKNMRVFTKTCRKDKIRREPLIMSEVKTICDVDGEFYKIIEGRPIRSFIDIKVYMQNIRYITLTKASICYLRDLMIQIDTEISDEMKELNEVDKLYEEVKSSFVNFAKQSFESAKSFQKESDDRALLLDGAIDELNGYSFIFNKLRNEVDNFIAIFKILSTYGQFLYTISPIPWKELHHNKFAKLKSLSMTLFSFNAFLPTDDLKHDILIPFLKNDNPELYFKNPKEVIHIFDEMSKQCLNYMEMDVFTSNTLRSVLNRRDYLRQVLKYETDEMEEIITINKNEINWLEKQEIEYKNKFNRILTNEFQNLFASYEVTKLFTCLQYVHTQVFETAEDPKDSIVTLASNLEILYLDLSSKLDDLDQSVVKKAKHQLFAEDIKMMKNARIAQRSLKECDILTKCLFTSFEPPRRRHK